MTTPQEASTVTRILRRDPQIAELDLVAEILKTPSMIELASISPRHIDLSLLRILLAARHEDPTSSKNSNTPTLGERTEPFTTRFLERVLSKEVISSIEQHSPSCRPALETYLRESKACARIFDTFNFTQAVEESRQFSQGSRQEFIDSSTFNFRPRTPVEWNKLFLDCAKIATPSLTSSADQKRAVGGKEGITATTSYACKRVEAFFQAIKPVKSIDSVDTLVALVDRLTLYAAQAEFARRTEQIEKDFSSQTAHSNDSLKSFARLYVNSIEATTSIERWEKKLWCKESWLRDSVAVALIHYHTSDTPTWMMKDRDVYRPWKNRIAEDICSGTSKITTDAIVDAITLYPAFIPSDLVPCELRSLKEILPSTKILKPLLATKVGMITPKDAQTELVDAYQHGYAGQLERVAKDEIAQFCAAAKRLSTDKETPKVVRDRIKELSKMATEVDLTPLVVLDEKANRKTDIDLQPALKLCQESLWQVFVMPDGGKAIPVAIQMDRTSDELPSAAQIREARVLVIADKKSRSGTTQRGGTFYTVENLARLIGESEQPDMAKPTSSSGEDIDLSNSIHSSAKPSWVKSEITPTEEVFKIPVEHRLPSRQETVDNLMRAASYLKSFENVKFTDPGKAPNNSGSIINWETDRTVKITWSTPTSDDGSIFRATTTIRGVLELAYDLQWGILKIIR